MGFCVLTGKTSTKYAQIDITATEMAHKVGTQHALGRQEGLHTLELRRKGTPHWLLHHWNVDLSRRFVPKTSRLHHETSLRGLLSPDCSQKILRGLLWDAFSVLFHLLNTENICPVSIFSDSDFSNHKATWRWNLLWKVWRRIRSNISILVYFVDLGISLNGIVSVPEPQANAEEDVRVLSWVTGQDKPLEQKNFTAQSGHPSQHVICCFGPCLGRGGSSFGVYSYKDFTLIYSSVITTSVIPHVVARNSLFSIFIFGETFHPVLLRMLQFSGSQFQKITRFRFV